MFSKLRIKKKFSKKIRIIKILDLLLKKHSEIINFDVIYAILKIVLL